MSEYDRTTGVGSGIAIAVLLPGRCWCAGWSSSSCTSGPTWGRATTGSVTALCSAGTSAQLPCPSSSPRSP
ncbi:hypothetical protein P9139_20775 [Curtobacterium flaccumfaciens]|nr:hypothetical protein P9139_20775 [Curtobacterium flaccumfaciens]